MREACRGFKSFDCDQVATATRIEERNESAILTRVSLGEGVRRCKGSGGERSEFIGTIRWRIDNVSAQFRFNCYVRSPDQAIGRALHKRSEVVVQDDSKKRHGGATDHKKAPFNRGSQTMSIKVLADSATVNMRG